MSVYMEGCIRYRYLFRSTSWVNTAVGIAVADEQVPCNASKYGYLAARNGIPGSYLPYFA